jgi:hypothetical protein
VLRPVRCTSGWRTSTDANERSESPNAQAYGLPKTLTVANFSNLGQLAHDSNYGAHHVQIASLGDTL